MKQFLMLAITLLFIACTKDETPASPTPIADAYIGAYNVTEGVSILWNSTFWQQSSFVGEIIKADSSDRIKFIQSRRNPKPAWVGWSSDTIVYKIYPLTDSLKNPYGGIAGGKIIGKDTLQTQYLYGAGSVSYQVHQTWVRKK